MLAACATEVMCPKLGQAAFLFYFQPAFPGIAIIVLCRNASIPEGYFNFVLDAGRFPIHGSLVSAPAGVSGYFSMFIRCVGAGSRGYITFGIAPSCSKVG